jgi:chemotaxis protein methyltransferase CheR
MIAGTDFLALQKLLQDRAGMALSSDKLYLVASRLGPVAQKLGLRGVIELMAALRERPTEAMIAAVIEAMVTHESLFFRDAKPFEQMAQIAVPHLMRTRAARKTVRIWSAACSSGQEAYSLAMQIAESASAAPGWRWDVTGTDISAPIVEKARAGIYSAFEIRRGLSEERIARHFRRLDDGNFQAVDAIRRAVTFRTHNLLESAAHLGAFDIVFCRNVLIYFDQPTKARVLELIARQMAPDGYLFLGSADSVIGVTNKFAAVGQERGMYQPAAQAALKIA